MKDIFISRTYLPPLKKYTSYLKKLWKSRYLTNNGIYVQELEEKLKQRWGVRNVVCVNNGTLATMLAIKALGITKKIYVSPYSYVSTVSVPLWMGIKPIFVDIYDKWKTPALVTHVYGIQNIVDISPVIYDASHAFSSVYNGNSVLQYGDVSIISFHATKIFQTIEGGAVVTNNDELAEKVRWMRNFGHNGQYEYFGAGINCKMSEFNATIGLCVLPMVDMIKKRYDEIIEIYNKELGYSWKDVTYYPIYYPSEKKVLKSIKIFEKNHIYPRRYFYPPLNKVFNGKSCPDTEDLMSRVLCLPFYYELTDQDITKIIKIAKETLC